MQTICELDENDAHVLDHRQQHLTEVLGLFVLDAVELDATDLGDTLHQQSDVRAEAPVLLLRDTRDAEQHEVPAADIKWELVLPPEHRVVEFVAGAVDIA